MVFFRREGIESEKTLRIAYLAVWRQHEIKMRAGAERRRNDMWTVVYMAQNRDFVQQLQKILEEGGLIVKVRPVCKDAGDNCFEVLVPESEIEQAHEIIIENGF